MVRFKEKKYTQWDETDSLKRMKDSDILAQQKRENPSRLIGAAKGAGYGSIGGAVVGGLMGIRSGNIMKGIKRGAMLGGTVGAIGGSMSGSQQRKENNFYNSRLEYAQRKAMKREKADWKQNMTQREGYSY